MTASRLGKTAEVSEATVIRFAMELGFDGYPGMQKALQQAMLHRLSSTRSEETARDRITDVLQTDAEMLLHTAETLNRDVFSFAVNAMLNASSIYVIGVRSSVALAEFAGFYLNYLFQNVHIITASGFEDMIERTVHIGKKDMVLAFDFPPYSSAVAAVTRFSQSTGAATVAVTNSYSSPIALCCDNVLVAQSDREFMIAPFGVVNALLVALASEREEVLAQNRNKIERIRELYEEVDKR